MVDCSSRVFWWRQSGSWEHNYSDLKTYINRSVIHFAHATAINNQLCNICRELNNCMVMQTHEAKSCQNLWLLFIIMWLSLRKQGIWAKTTPYHITLQVITQQWKKIFYYLYCKANYMFHTCLNFYDNSVSS